MPLKDGRGFATIIELCCCFDSSRASSSELSMSSVGTGADVLGRSLINFCYTIVSNIHTEGGKLVTNGKQFGKSGVNTVGTTYGRDHSTNI